MVLGFAYWLSAPLVSDRSRGRRSYYPPARCELTKQGERFLLALAAAKEPSASTGLLRKFVASSSKHVALNTLSHLLSPSTFHPRLCSFAFPLYSLIEQEVWFSWNAKLVAGLVASLYRQEKFNEAENLFSETVLRLRFKERDLCMFYCHLVDSHAKHKSVSGVFYICTRLNQLMIQSSSLYVKQRGYESMAGGFCEVGFPDKAENLIEEMREMGLKPSVYRYLIYGYGQMGFLEDMMRCLVQMEKEGFETDTVCCNMVLSSLGSQNKILDMISWLKKMKNSNILLSIRTYNSALNSCPNLILLLKDLKKVPLSIKELLDTLNEEEACLVLELEKSSVLGQVMECNASELKLDLHGMHLVTAYLILLLWFDELKLRFISGQGVIPAQVLVVCGSGKHSFTRGESPVKGLAKEMMIRMNCPLRIDRKNNGCFLAKGKVLKDWLCHDDGNKIPSDSIESTYIQY